MLPILLITRPLPQARRFAAEAESACPAHEALLAPLSEVVALPFDPSVFAGAKGLILTSANAVPMLPPLPGLQAWCVGPATAKAARAAGLTPLDGGGDAAALIATLKAAQPAGPLVHAHGRHLSRDLVAALPALDLRGVRVYEARALDFPPDVLSRLAHRRVIVPLFSPRAARNLARQAGVLSLRGMVPVAISPACAEALPEELHAQTIIAGSPDGPAMLRAVAVALSQTAPAG
ncbi:MAG: uroporphyrinogen-III synthase [Pararhodobacter sp.]